MTVLNNEVGALAYSQCNCGERRLAVGPDSFSIPTVHLPHRTAPPAPVALEPPPPSPPTTSRKVLHNGRRGREKCEVGVLVQESFATPLTHVSEAGKRFPSLRNSKIDEGAEFACR